MLPNGVVDMFGQCPHAGMSTLPKYPPDEKSKEMKCPFAGALQKRLQRVKCNFKYTLASFGGA